MTSLKAKWLLLAGMLLLALTPILAFTQEVADPPNLGIEQFALREDVVQGALATEQMLYMRLIPLGFILILTTLVMLFANQRDKRRQALFAQFVEKGQEIPASLLPAPPSGLRDMRIGVWLTSLGTGLGVVLYIASGDVRVAAWCLILLFLGAASFLNAKLFHPKSGSEQ